MSTPNRAALLTKIHRVLKKQYKVTPPRGDQNALEAMLFACCLENARCEAATRAFETLKSSFFDWNEIRVSTVKELSEVLAALHEPAAAAAHLKGILQTVFESDYSFDLEHLKKQNIGQAIKRMQKFQGATPFVVSFATQTALGGHAIPVDRGTLHVLYVLGVVSQAELQAGTVPGMERAISKSKGLEFGALLHELGAEYVANPFSPTLRDFLLSISPDAKDRFPKRKKPAAGPAEAKVPAKPEPLAAKKPEPEPKAKQPAKAAASAPKRKPAEAKKKSSARQLTKRKPR